MSAGHRTPEYLAFIKRERPRWQAQINAAGAVPCRRCRGAILAGQKWDLGHIVAMAEGGPLTPENTWPEHPRCNRSAGQELSVKRKAAEDRRVFKL